VNSVNKLRSWSYHLAEKTDFGAVVEHRRLLNGGVSWLQYPAIWKGGKQLVELSMPHDLHATNCRHAVLQTRTCHVD